MTWAIKDLGAATNPGGGFACYGLGGYGARVYSMTRSIADNPGTIYELAWENGWQPPTPLATNAPPLEWVPLTCFGIGGYDARVYYQGRDGIIYELAWENAAWQAPTATPAASTAQQINLTCYGVGGKVTRVYYQGTDGSIYELAWMDKWVVSKPLAENAVEGTSLTCFGIGGYDAHVYYQGWLPDTTQSPATTIYELAWTNGAWQAPQPTPAKNAGTGTNLTCYGVGGKVTRVYYQDDQSEHIYELAWI